MLGAVVEHDHAAWLGAPSEPGLGRGHFLRMSHVQGIISAQHVPHDEVRVCPDAPRLGRGHFPVGGRNNGSNPSMESSADCTYGAVEVRHPRS